MPNWVGKKDVEKAVDEAVAKSDALKALTLGTDTPEPNPRPKLWVEVSGEKDGYRFRIKTDASDEKLPYKKGRYQLSAFGTDNKYYPHKWARASILVEAAQEFLEEYIEDYDRFFVSFKIDEDGKVYDAVNLENDD